MARIISAAVCARSDGSLTRVWQDIVLGARSTMTHEERKLATILFADLVGSTELADGEDPERVRFALNRFYDAMTAVLERFGGTVEKFAGDAVMAVFGAPVAQEDHAERALHAALAMRARLEELFGGRLTLRIGVNSGDVVAGEARAGSSFVAGDVVNVAARLEQAAAPGQILAGERTASAAGGAFAFGERVVVEAKGKPDGIVARTVERSLASMRPRGVRDLARVFVGRDREFAALRELYERVVTEGLPHHVTILAEAGVGKSRLLHEFTSWLEERTPSPVRRAGRALSYGQGTSYWPLAEVLKEQFGLTEGDSRETIAGRLADRPYLGMTLGLGVNEDVHPLVARERFHDAWVSLLSEIVAERPAIIILEDLHWADTDLFDLVDGIVREVSGSLLVLVTARLEILDRRPAWGGAWGRTSSIRLDPLPADVTGRMFGELVECEIPAPIQALVLDRAEGNPFFVEEMIATFIDRGVLVRRNGSWTFGALPAGFEIPDTVHAVLAARIDVLREDDRSALQAAAVIGRTFWTGPTYELLAGASPDIGLLEDHEFIRRRPTSSLPGEREYMFKHALTRDVAYASLPRARRARLHAAFAGWLERRAEGRDDLAPLLAHHFTEAVRPDDLDLAWSDQEAEVVRLRGAAVTWSRRAAEAAIGRYEIDDALTLLEQAATLEADRAEQASLWFEIGHARALKYDGAGMVTALERSLELGASPAVVYPELAYQTVNRAGMWLRRLDSDLVDDWIKRAVDAAPAGSRDQARALVARAIWHDDLAGAEDALLVAEAIGDAEIISAALGAKASALEYRGKAGEAWDVTEAQDAVLPAVADPDHRAEALFARVGLAIDLGRLAAARDLTERLEGIVQRLTPHHRVHGLMCRVLVESATAHQDAVRDLTPRVRAAVEANIATPCPANVGLLLLCAIAAAESDDDGDAARLMAAAESIGMAGYGRSHAARGLRMAIVRRDADETRRQIDALDPAWLGLGAFELWAALFDGLALLGDRERVEAEAPAWIRLDRYVAPFAVRALGIVQEDPDLIRDAVARFEAMGLDRHAALTREMIGRLA